MKIQDNFSDTHLLFTAPVNFTIYSDDQPILLAKFQIKLPCVQDLFFNENITSLLSLLKQTPAELTKKFNIGIEFTSHLELFQTLVILSAQVPDIAIIWDRIFDGLLFLCPDIQINEGMIKIQGALADDELFERFRDIWLIASGNKTFSQAYKYMSPEQRAYEDKIRAIRNNGVSQKKDISFEKIYMILTYEFGYSRADILGMTMHTVNTIIKYTSKSINYKLTLAAKAHGNTKKVKFITDQGD